ncbi:MAG: glycosyltransferase [Acidobacteriota bacterium]|nr:glycosyltransferase [Acidobacteriota bacterium]
MGIHRSLLVAPLDANARTDLSIVLPTYNEAANIVAVLEQLMARLDSIPGLIYEIIVVDDDSPDRTWEKAEQVAEIFPRVLVVRRQTERGLSTAVIRGWQVASGRVLGVMDADLQHPPEVTEKLWAEIARGADLAIASRHVEGGGVSDWSLARRIISRCAQLIGLAILPEVTARVSDPMSGYFMISREAIAGRQLNPLGYKILIEVLGRGKVRWISEVPYVFRERAEGSSKVTNRIYLEYFQHLLRIRFHLLKSSSFFRFCLVGLSGVAIDMALLYLLSDPSTLHWGLTRSKVLASEAALINNFMWNDLWTFAEISRHQSQFGQRVKRFLKFNAICALGLLLNVLILNFEFNKLHMNRYAANLIAIAIVTIWNYGTNWKLNWRVTSKD